MHSAVFSLHLHRKHSLIHSIENVEEIPWPFIQNKSLQERSLFFISIWISQRVTDPLAPNYKNNRLRKLRGLRILSPRQHFAVGTKPKRKQQMLEPNQEALITENVNVAVEQDQREALLLNETVNLVLDSEEHLAIDEPDGAADARIGSRFKNCS